MVVRFHLSIIWLAKTMKSTVIWYAEMTSAGKFLRYWKKEQQINRFVKQSNWYPPTQLAVINCLICEGFMIKNHATTKKKATNHENDWYFPITFYNIDYRKSHVSSIKSLLCKIITCVLLLINCLGPADSSIGTELEWPTKKKKTNGKDFSRSNPWQWK